MVNLKNILTLNDPNQVILFGSGKKTLSTSQWMKSLAENISSLGLKVELFDLQPPFEEEHLLRQYRQKVEALRKQYSKILVGGKSQGSRVGVLIASEYSEIQGCFCVSYPFYTPVIRDNRRVLPLQKMEKPVLIIQGEFDQYGEKILVEKSKLSSFVTIDWIKGGDHQLSHLTDQIFQSFKSFFLS